MSARPQISFEFFPPKTPEMEAALWRTVRDLEPLAPRFVSVTYGAGGSTRERTHATVARLRRETRLEPAAHLTCIGADRADIAAVADSYRAAGIRHIVALRGDIPAGYRAPEDAYTDAAELCAGLTRLGGFDLSVAAYPETHPDAASPEADLDHLKRKIDAGARRAITQFFFDPAVFLRFRDRACRAGIDVPIVPGILPIANFAQIRKFAAQCGADIPAAVARRFEDGDAPEIEIGADIAARQCLDLIAAGIGEFHFYTLNRAAPVRAVCERIGAYSGACVA